MAESFDMEVRKNAKWTERSSRIHDNVIVTDGTFSLK